MEHFLKEAFAVWFSFPHKTAEKYYMTGRTVATVVAEAKARVWEEFRDSMECLYSPKEILENCFNDPERERRDHPRLCFNWLMIQMEDIICNPCWGSHRRQVNVRFVGLEKCYDNLPWFILWGAIGLRRGWVTFKNYPAYTKKYIWIIGIKMTLFPMLVHSLSNCLLSFIHFVAFVVNIEFSQFLVHVVLFGVVKP